MDGMKVIFILVLLNEIYSVHSLDYILKRFMGNEDVGIKNGTRMNSSTVYITLGGSSFLCSSICIRDISCVAFSVDTSTACYFFSQIFSFIYNASQTTYLYSVTSFRLLSGATAFYHADGTLYMFSPVQTQTWQQSYDLCYSVQGFITLQPKKIYQFQLLNQQYTDNYNGYNALGLRRNYTTNQIYFDDGTPYQNTEVANYTTPAVNDFQSTIFLFYDHHFEDFRAITPLFPSTPICHGDPYNVTGDLAHA